MSAGQMSIDDPRNKRVMVIQVNSKNTGSAGIECIITHQMNKRRDWYQCEFWSEDALDRIHPHRFRTIEAAALRGLGMLLKEYKP